jgi:NitT/TauT family transport system substrate-binding protein
LRTARIAIPDLVSNSYFPAIAAVALDFFKREGLDVTQDLIFPNYKAYEALRDNKVDFVAAPAHVALAAFPQWHGCKLLMALSQGMFWLLVLRADIAATPGDVSSVKGRAIGAAPMVELGLKQVLIDAGVDLEADGVRMVGVPGADAPGVSFGVAAARALAEGAIDGFWANAMGAENAVRQGVGKVILDVRRGIGPVAAFHYTMPVLVTSDALLERDPELIAAGMRAVLAAQRALKADVRLATTVGRGLFAPAEAALIADVVARDLPYYDPAISETAIDGLNRFAQSAGLLRERVPYADIVAMSLRHLWVADC